MPFDPSKPGNGSPLSSAEMRSQLAALKALIDAVPQGPPGPPGPVNLFVDENDPGGSDGDVWLRPSDGEVFRHEGGGWVDKGSLKGPQGNPGDKGDKGDQGDKGDKGDPGEVSNQQLSDAINGTANNVNSVATLTLSLDDPPTAAQVQQVVDKLNEFITAAHR